MKAEAPAGGQNRPPTGIAAGHAGASVRRTAQIRPTVAVRIIDSSARFEPSDPYVRRFWVAAIGPSAVAELLRLVQAGLKGEDVRLPRSLPTLVRAGLARIESNAIAVVDRIPEVPVELRWRFPPSLAAEHSRLIGPSRP